MQHEASNVCVNMGTMTQAIHELTPTCAIAEWRILAFFCGSWDILKCKIVGIYTSDTF